LKLLITKSTSKVVCFAVPLFTVVDRTIEKALYSGIILPGSDWQTLSHSGRSAKIKYRIRVQCMPNYYNATCTKLCRPRDDRFGHYSCDNNGNKVCLQGWIGQNCMSRKENPTLK
jgi:jagged-like protein